MKLVPHKTWFVARYFGRGWYPETWEGWAISLLYICLVLISYFSVSTTIFIALTVGLSCIYLFICHKKSRQPRSKVDQKEKTWKAGKIL